MNDEIKEILKNIKKVANRETASRNVLMEMKDTDYQLLLDYITNLQQENQELKSKLECYENGVYFSSKVDELERENERLKEKSINEVLKNDFDMCVKDLKKANKKIEKLEDYKSRCEKAVEYIKEDYERNQEVIEYCGFDGFYKKLLNILNGKELEKM